MALTFLVIVLSLEIATRPVWATTTGQNINQVLNIFKTCYTDLIFCESNFDISEPDYPILISTLQQRPSVTPPTFREGENLTLVSHFGSMPRFESVSGTSPKPIRVRFSCVSLVLVGGYENIYLQAPYISQSIKNRHHWIHPTKYDSDTTLYPGNVYINRLTTQSSTRHRSPYQNTGFWIDHLYLNGRVDYYREIPVYFWIFPGRYQMYMELELRILLNPHCSDPIFTGNVTLSALNLKELGIIFNTGLQNHCQNPFLVELNGMNVNQAEIFYYGPPALPKTLAYPRNELGQLLHKSAIFFIVFSSFVNCSVLSFAAGYDWVLAKPDLALLYGSPDVIKLSNEQTNDQISSCAGEFFPTKTSEFNFLTCDLSEALIDFGAFLKPFDGQVWLFLGLVVLVCSGFLVMLLRSKRQTENVLLLLYSALVEHGYHFRGSVLSLPSFNVFLTVFLFMSIVLTNGYKGIVITNIIAPLTGRQHISTFQEAVDENYTIITPYPLLQNRFLKVLQLNNETEVRSHFHKHYDSEVMFINTAFGKSLRAALQHTTTGNLPLLRIIRNSWVSWFERDLSILYNGTEPEFMKCNKSILVDNSQELKIVFAKLSEFVQSNNKAGTTNVRLNFAKEGILTQSWGIYLTNQKCDNGLLAKRMGYLMSSGIPNQFRKMEEVGLVKWLGKKELKSRLPHPLNLNTNILTLFAVYALGISLSIIWLSIEYVVIPISYEQLRRCIHLSAKHFVNAIQNIILMIRTMRHENVSIFS